MTTISDGAAAAAAAATAAAATAAAPTTVLRRYACSGQGGLHVASYDGVACDIVQRRSSETESE